MRRCYVCDQPNCRFCRVTWTGVGVAAAVAFVSWLSGCGASAELRAAYALEQARCIANEQEIIDRAGSTYEEDVADLAEERLRCDAALDAIEGGR